MPIGFIADNHEGEINVTRMANAPEMQRHSVPKKQRRKPLDAAISGCAATSGKPRLSSPAQPLGGWIYEQKRFGLFID